MEKDRGLRVLAIIAICIAVVGLSIGYATLQQTLTINTTAKAKAQTWSVKFANLTDPTLVGKATVTNKAVLNTESTGITVDVALSVPGDSVTYTFDVTNAGTIDAKLSSEPTINGTGTTGNNVPLNYALTYADGTKVSANDTLNVGETKHLKLVVTYNASVDTVPETDTSYTFNASMLY